MDESAGLLPNSHVLARCLAQADGYIQRSKAANTLKAYQSDWASFEAFCRKHHQPSLPATPETVAGYAAQMAEHLKANTVERRLTAISQAHQFAGYANPAESKLVRILMAGIRRVKGTAQQGKQPLSPELLRRMLTDQPQHLRAIRDRALLLVGFAGAFRRSELVGLTYNDVRFTNDGLTITIAHSKTDQRGDGHTIGIPYGTRPDTCPVRALRMWLERSNIAGGHLFRSIGRWGSEVSPSPISDHQLAKIIKALARQAGLEAGAFSGHSLRSGLATSAAEGGASERSIMEQTRHKSLTQVRKYIRRGNLFIDNAAAKSGL